MSQEIPLQPHDLETLLHCSVHYALGRMSYMPGVVADLVRKYWPQLSPGFQVSLTRNLESDIARYDRAGKLIGMDVDDRMWRDLLAWCKENS